MQAFDPIAAPLDGTHLIEASAGTGKTFTIGTLYLRAVVERGLRPGSILVVTYTKAATAELRHRLRERIRETLSTLETQTAPRDTDLERLLALWEAQGLGNRAHTALEAALRDLDEAAVHTIHGFCQRMLQDLAFESGAPFSAELVTDEAPLRDEIVRDFWVRATYEAPEALLRRLRTPEFSLTALMGLAMRVGGNPSLPVIPDTIAAAPDAIGVAVASHRQAVAAAAAIWDRERATIAALLVHPSLNRNKYRPDTVEQKWLPKLDELLAGDTAPWPSTALPLFKLTTTGLAAGTRKNGTPPGHAFFAACDTLYAANESLQTTLDTEGRRLCLDLVAYVRTERQRRREATNTRAFDDLQLLLHGALHGSGGTSLATTIRDRFPFALIDECQDTDPLQHAIFDRIYGQDDDEGRSGFYRIGDPKQAIFAFRGADVFTYLEAKRAVGGAARTLTTNWRSDPSLIRGVHAVFARPRDPFLLADIVPHPVHARPDARDASSESGLRLLFVPDVPGATKAEITRRVVDGTIAEIAVALDSPHAPAARDIAVLCRTNRQAIAIQEGLRRRSIPSVLRGDKSVFDTPEAEDMQRLTQAIATPTDAAAIRSALATTILGVDGPALHTLQDDEHAWDAWARRFERWHGLWAGYRFVRAFRQLVDERDVHARLLGLVAGERRLTNVLHLVELIHRAETDGHRGPAQTVRWLQQMRADPAARGAYSGEAEQVRLESDDDAVTVVTIHKSKGLEYPIVFCPFLWEDAGLFAEDSRWVRFHDADDQERLKLDIGSDAHDAHKALAEREALAESLRLTYVALTRAKHQCSVVWGPFASGRKSPLAYLLHQPDTPEPGADLPAATSTRVAGLDATALRRDLDALAAAVPDTISVRDLAAATAGPRARRPTSAAAELPLAARHSARRVPAGRRVSSFSALTADASEYSPRVEEGIDHDARTVRAEAYEGAVATIALDEFPTGAATGQLLHGILEHLDFQSPPATALRDVVAPALARHGISPHWQRPLTQALTTILDTPLGFDAAPNATLRTIAENDRRPEMEFVIPAARMLTAGSLAAVFARHQAPAACPDYGTRVAALGFEPLTGYLRGFIDLVFRFGDRWYVVDYKSNHLGSTPHDYAPARLARVMDEHHYVLQYHLYTLAVHRHLRTRLPGYDYARDFGGILYLFLRGMDPDHPPGYGIFHDRPSPPLLDDLDALVAPA